MDKAFLEDCLRRGMSLPEIGALVNRDPSTVGYWVQKHGLTANGKAKYAPRGGLRRDQLAPLVEDGRTLEEIAAALDRSTCTVRYWIARHELDSPKAVRRRQYETARADGRRTYTARCSTHGLTTFVIENSGGGRCRQCRMDKVTAWRRRAKRKLVAEAGGKCQLCGYDRCQAALEFHHLDPTTKRFGLSVRGVTRSFDTLQEEVRKCVLLCSNCHAEVEVGYAKVDATRTK